MFSITVLVLSYGIISICAQECKDVRMKMSTTKPGRVELDVDQFCRCAGYSRTATADESEYSKWKKPTIEPDIDTEILKTKDKSTTMKTIYDITDIVREDTKENATDERPIIMTTKKYIETKNLTDESYTKTIDKIPIIMTTTESIYTGSTDKRDTYEKSSLTSDIASAKEDVIVEDKNSTHYIHKIMLKNSTEKEIIIIPKAKKTTTTEIADEGVLATESKKDISMRESFEDKTTYNSSGKTPTTEKYSGKVTKSNITGLIYSVATTMTTERSVDKSTYKNSTHEFIDVDMATEKSDEMDEITVKSPATLTSKKIGDNSTTVKTTDKITTRKPSLDSTTDVLIDKTNKSIPEESVVKGIEDSTTKTSKTVVATYAVPYHRSDTPHTNTTIVKPIDKTSKRITEDSVVKDIEHNTTKTSETVVVTYVPHHKPDKPQTTTEVYKYEKKAENSSEAAPEKSHMKEESDYGLQIFLILLCIIVSSVFILAVIYTVYMSHRSNSYVLPTVDETTPLNKL